MYKKNPHHTEYSPSYPASRGAENSAMRLRHVALLRSNKDTPSQIRLEGGKAPVLIFLQEVNQTFFFAARKQRAHLRVRGRVMRPGNWGRSRVFDKQQFKKITCGNFTRADLFTVRLETAD